MRAPPPETFAYLRDPEAIYARSFELIERETDWRNTDATLKPVIRRMIHACGMTDLVTDVVASPDFVPAATAALTTGAAVVCDSRMVAHGIIRERLPATNDVVCSLDHLASAAEGDTRAAAALETVKDRLNRAVVAIGNAPTALFRLLELALADGVEPAAVIALPVGFVGAAESKHALIERSPFPFLTLRGRRGGSALAAAAVNALAGRHPA